MVNPPNGQNRTMLLSRASCPWNPLLQLNAALLIDVP